MLRLFNTELQAQIPAMEAESKEEFKKKNQPTNQVPQTNKTHTLKTSNKNLPKSPCMSFVLV